MHVLDGPKALFPALVWIDDGSSAGKLVPALGTKSHESQEYLRLRLQCREAFQKKRRFTVYKREGPHNKLNRKEGSASQLELLKKQLVLTERRRDKYKEDSVALGDELSRLAKELHLEVLRHDVTKASLEASQAQALVASTLIQVSRAEEALRVAEQEPQGAVNDAG